MPIRVKRGTTAAIDTIASEGGLLQGEPLYFTDIGIFGIATSNSTYNQFKLRKEASFNVSTINNNGSNGSVLTWSNVSHLTSFVNAGGGLFTVPVTGKYQLNASVLINTTAPAGGYTLETSRTGATGAEVIVGYVTKAASTYESLNISGVLSLTAGNQIRVVLTGPGGSSNVLYTVNPDALRYNRFSGFLIE